MSPYELLIPGDHPSLAGHFPDNPIVPGVVILEQVLQYAKQDGRLIEGIGSVKFISPLKPDVPCQLTFEPSRTGLSFTVNDGERTLASGTLQQREGV